MDKETKHEIVVGILLNVIVLIWGLVGAMIGMLLIEMGLV